MALRRDFGKALPNMASASDYDALIRRFEAAKFTHHRCDVALGRDENTSSASMTVSPWGMIARSRRKIAATRIDLGHVLAEGSEGLATRSVFIGLNRYQLRSPGEIQHLRRQGMDKAFDVLRHHLSG